MASGIRRNPDGWRYVVLPHGYTAFPMGGGYWHVNGPDDLLAMAWEPARVVRAFVALLLEGHRP